MATTPYATASDYAAYKGVADDYDTAERLRINAGLLAAQDDVNGQLRFAVYDLTNTAHTEALTRATCARFDYTEESGDDGSGLATQFNSMSLGSASLTRNSYASSATRSRLVDALGTKAATILWAAGFWSGVVAHS